MQGENVREIEWAPPKEAPPVFVAEDPPPEEYGPWQWAAAFGRATGRFGAEAFTMQENGRLRCPAGASLWLSEVRQENAFTRARRLSGLPDGLSALRSPRAVSGKRRPKAIVLGESVRSAVSCPRLPRFRESLSSSDQCDGWMWLVERFVALGPHTGVGNTWRCFRLRTGRRAFPLPLAHRVRCARITVGVGTIGSHGMPGGDHHNGASPWLAFLLLWLPTNKGGSSNQERLVQRHVISL